MATRISEKEMGLLLVQGIEPTNDQRETVNKLVKNYKLAINLVNAETMKG
jgi:hypothetical protein